MAADVVAFVVESAAPAALARRGFSTGDGVAARLLLGITPAAAVVPRGMFAAPRARFRPPLAGVLLVEAVVLGGGVCAVHAVGHPVGGGVLRGRGGREHGPDGDLSALRAAGRPTPLGPAVEDGRAGRSFK
ncbi:YrdB family protein [Streptomyces sp. NPDC093149]|uniref:YrdB family protein n=1 Tax=Streptomyces sp. NPDC093149 TaxID=3366031 RepID=UPI00381D1B2C